MALGAKARIYKSTHDKKYFQEEYFIEKSLLYIQG